MLPTHFPRWQTVYWWQWLALDGTMTKAPLGGEKNPVQPDRPRHKRRQAQPVDRWRRDSAGDYGGTGEPARHEAGAADAGQHDDLAEESRLQAALVHGLGNDYQQVRDEVWRAGMRASIRGWKDEAKGRVKPGGRGKRWVV